MLWGKNRGNITYAVSEPLIVFKRAKLLGTDEIIGIFDRESSSQFKLYGGLLSGIAVFPLSNLLSTHLLKLEITMSST